MRLLLDNNLSRRLVRSLADALPNAAHVADQGLETASDTEVWAFARASGYSIVTKDSDFNDLLVVHGPPPKVIWLRIGNCTTAQVEILLRSNLEKIALFVEDPSSGLLTLL